MKLEPCPFCGYDVINHYEVGGGYSECDRCTASGPTHDPTSEKWNAVSRAAHGAIPAAIESIEVGQMPWRLQIAVGLITKPAGSYYATWEDALSDADEIIAAHKATEDK